MLPAQTYKLFTFVLTYALLNRFADAQTTWIVSGDCTIVADEPACVTSLNYPNDYGVLESCTMNFASGEAMVLSVVSFSTETTYDYLTVNGNDYSGSADGLDGVLASGQMRWVSDISITATGWKICASEHGSDAGEDVPETTTMPATTTTPDPAQTSGTWKVKGHCEIVAEEPSCITSLNYPSPYATSGDHQYCTMESSSGKALVLSVVSFETGEGANFFNVNEWGYSGDGLGLDGLVAFGQMSWRADWPITASGWKVCAKELAEAGPWNIEGHCTIVAEEPACIISLNYPSTYAPRWYCKMEFPSDEAMVLSVISFGTELPGYFTVNGSVYSGAGFQNGFDGVVAPGEISWWSVASITASGWKICARELGSEVGEAVPETTTPATTNSDPTQTSGIWNVDGDCRIVAEDPACITSMNYPSAYGNQEFCAMEWTPGGAYRVLLVESFETEEGADFFTMNGIMYSGAGDGLNGVGAYGQIIWTSDESTTASGWKICARELVIEVESEDESPLLADFRASAHAKFSFCVCARSA